MELSEAVHRRRMVRHYDSQRPVPKVTLLACLRAATRAPSAGFSQGWDFVVLQDKQRWAFWDAAVPADQTHEPPDRWLTGMRTAPVLVVCASDPARYAARYAETDKSTTGHRAHDRDPSTWPIPYWDVDTGMAALLIMLTALDHGLGSCFFGVPPGAHDPVKAALGIPARRRLVGVVSLGYAAPEAADPVRRRRSPGRPIRRSLDDVTHWGHFGRLSPPDPVA
ncbi:MAG: nitroreductase [Actinomycetales bacterium]|nr:MAG: nitroreductase [Actinomycetales bacterium]